MEFPNEHPNTSLARKALKIGAVVTFYITVSVALVFLNKYILSYAQFPFSFPLFITWFQLAMALLFIITLGVNKRWFPCLSAIPAFEFKMGTASNVMWLTIVYICMLATNNICLQYVEVSFFQIARSLTVAFQVLLTRVLLNESTSGQALVGCGVVIIGFLLGSEGEVHFSWIGSFFGVLSSLFVALHGIKVKSVLDVMNKDEWKLILYNTQLSVVLLLPILWASGEISDVLLYLEDLGAESKIPAATEGDLSTSHFWFLMVLASILGFLINVSVFLLIKNTSPLTSVIVGAVKSCLQSILSIMIFQNPISFMNGVGLTLTIVGSCVYSTARFFEMRKRLNAPPEKTDA